MAENKEPVVENITKEEVTEDKIQVKKKSPKKIFEQPKDNITKVDVSTPSPEKPVESITKVDLTKSPEKPETVEEVKETAPVLEEIKVEKKPETLQEVSKETVKPKMDLPENIQKVVDFVNDTGGSLEDYVRLNKNYDDIDTSILLKEYYQSTKPHLNHEEIDFMLEDRFSYDEENDDEKDIKRKKLALKEQVASAKSHLDGLKSKYYDEVKVGSGLTESQKEAIDFFNRYTEKSAEQKTIADHQTQVFQDKTDNVFSNDFKGFEYNVGDKKFRFNVKDMESVKEEQSDLSNFVGKFLDKDNLINDAENYHKSLFTARNADAIANHFYEQGRVDALKQSVSDAKNIDMAPRQSHGSEEKAPGGMTFKVLGDSADDFKFKIKKRK